MKRMMICLSMIGLLPVAGRAQPNTPPTSTARAFDIKAMYEDIEIMRRLLSQELRGQNRNGVNFPYPLNSIEYNLNRDPAAGRIVLWRDQQLNATSKPYRPPQNGTTTLLDPALRDSTWVDLGVAFADFDIDGRWDSFVANGRGPLIPNSIEGVYLNGHGVVYTVSLSASETADLNTPEKSNALMAGCAKCHEAATVRQLIDPGKGPVPTPATPWERTRQQVRGIKETSPPHPAIQNQVPKICAPGNLNELSLKLLVENGHHFKQLAANESITVVITDNGAKSEPVPVKIDPKLPMGHTYAGAIKTAEATSGVGDLHAKQNAHASALASYLDAIKPLTGQPLIVGPTSPADMVNQYIEDATRLLRNAHAKCAQQYLALGQLKEARAALDKAANATVSVKIAQAPASPAAPAASPLPAKLIITVSKKALDDVHTGKINADQFKKLANVETINFPPVEKKK